MSKNSFDNLGNQISDSVRSALQSGDLSKLKDIGPAVQDAVRDIPVNLQGRSDAGGHAPANNGPEGHPYVQQAQPRQNRPAPSPPPRRQPPAWHGSAAPKRYYGPSSSAGVAAIVFGVLGMVATGICAFVFGALALVSSSIGLGIAAGSSFVAFLASGGLTGAGNRKRKLASRIRQYYNQLARSQHKIESFDQLSARTGYNILDIKKDVKKGMASRMMPDVRMDKDETCLMQGEEAYKLYLESEEERRKREAEEAERQRRLSDPVTAGLEAFREEGAAMLKSIRDANAAISGTEISDKLYTLENTTKRIFDYIEKHPEKLGDTRRFMSYYLPTTLKLLEKYRQYDQTEIQVASIVKAKEEIESTLDTINTAFLNLLDSLYQDDTLDVSTDIEVLQQVLEQEGLTGQRFKVKAEIPPEDDTPSLTL